jgi:hypothetical protein
VATGVEIVAAHHREGNDDENEGRACDSDMDVVDLGFVVLDSVTEWPASCEGRLREDDDKGEEGDK